MTLYCWAFGKIFSTKYQPVHKILITGFPHRLTAWEMREGLLLRFASIYSWSLQQFYSYANGTMTSSSPVWALNACFPQTIAGNSAVTRCRQHLWCAGKWMYLTVNNPGTGDQTEKIPIVWCHCNTDSFSFFFVNRRHKPQILSSSLALSCWHTECQERNRFSFCFPTNIVALLRLAHM